MKIPGSDGFAKDAISRAKLKVSKKIDSKESSISKKGKTSTPAASAEKVEVSSRAQEAAKINEIIKASPDIRAEKIEKIKGEIANGTYSVDGKKIAEKILNEVLSENIFLDNK